MYTPIVKNHVNGFRGNRAFFHSAIEFIFGNKRSWVPINDLAYIKMSWGMQGRSNMLPVHYAWFHTLHADFAVMWLIFSVLCSL